MEIRNINESEFYRLIEENVHFMVGFSADWCTDCKETDSLLTEFARENPHIGVYRLDVDENTDAANRYGVINVPSLLVFEDKKIKSKAEGKLTKEDISELI